uniref:Secreted protein n=1 Tax=Acanthochromis polyacanthus TaxID=80966 RepID=A0A3Q1GEF6_9TELE
MIIPLQISTMSPLVILLVVSLASQCWTAPQRRNWTPQAILYLKGARKMLHSRRQMITAFLSQSMSPLVFSPASTSVQTDGYS